MSWKMFGQIVLLIIIAVLIMALARTIKYSICGMGKAKNIQPMPKYSQNFRPNMPAQK